MQKQKLVPKISEHVSLHPFSKDAYLVHQSEHEHRIKVNSDAYNVLCLIDNKKNLEQICLESHGELNIEELFDLLYVNFGTYGIIESEYVSVKKSTKPDYLKLSFIVFPERLISKLTNYLKFLFTPKLMYTILVLCALLIVSTSIYSYDLIVLEKIQKQDWAILLLLGFISVTFHELGHASATSFFGAKHGGIGGGFYLLSPVYFADVSDIWKLKPKQRIIVNLAGIYFELIMSSIYVIIGFAFSQNLLLVIGLLIFFKSLFNLNPFLRSDGYWVLSDATNIPNLHKVSRTHLKSLTSMLFKKHKGNFTVSKKTWLLSIYAMFNFVILASFIIYFIFSNPKSVLYFPYNFYLFIQEIIQGTKAFSLINLQQFILPIFFYYLSFRLIKGVFTKKRQR